MNEKSTVALTQSLAQITERALSTRARLGHVALLLAATGMSILIAALLVTEPALPLRTYLSFAALLAMGACWIGYAVWVLMNRHTLLANHRIVAARMAVTFAAVFALGAFALGFTTGSRAMYFAAALGGGMFALAVGLLLRAHRRFRELQARRRVLERELQGKS